MDDARLVRRRLGRKFQLLWKIAVEHSLVFPLTKAFGNALGKRCVLEGNATAPANAQPNISEAGLSSQSALTKVQWRGHRGYWRGHRGWDGDGVGLGLGVAGALLGGAIIANEYDGDGYYDGTAYDGDDGVGRCAATFRSFDPNTGTYVGYDGIVRPCPYL